MTSAESIVILCAIPLDFEAGELAESLVNERLAACVQIGANVTSVYRWREKIEKADERLLLIKTRRSLFREVEAAIRARHPYDVPEIIALPILDGHAPYLAWIAETTTAD